MSRKTTGNGWGMIDHTDEVMAVASNATERAITTGTIMVERDTQRLLNLEGMQPKQVAAARKAGLQTASKPGEPPWKKTGHLGRSIESETFKRGGGFFGRVGTNVKYGAYLEFGAPRANIMPRPYLRPALDMNRAKIRALIGKAIP